MQLIVAVGARPNVVKVAPLLPVLERAGIGVDVAFTGSRASSRDESVGAPTFFGVPMRAPRWYLDVGTDTHAVTTARAMHAFESLFATKRPDAVMVIGDVNPTLAAAISAARARLPIIHLGAGLRSRDLNMPEEVNRVLISRITALHLAPTEQALNNLLSEGVPSDRVHFVGNMLAESVLCHLDDVKRLNAAEDHGLAPRRYALGSFHRPENLAVRKRLVGICEGMSTSGMTTLVPDDGAFAGAMDDCGLTAELRPTLISSVPYRTMLALMRDAACVVTDSSGVQEEACTIGTPCVTVAGRTEHEATVAIGANQLSEATQHDVASAVRSAAQSGRVWPTPQRWDRAVSDRIVRAIRRGVAPLN